MSDLDKEIWSLIKGKVEVVIPLKRKTCISEIELLMPREPQTFEDYLNKWSRIAKETITGARWAFNFCLSH